MAGVLAIIGELIFEVVFTGVAVVIAYVFGTMAWLLWISTRPHAVDPEVRNLPLSRRLFRWRGDGLHPVVQGERFDLLAAITAPVLFVVVLLAVAFFIVELIVLGLIGFAILGFREVSRRLTP